MIVYYCYINAVTGFNLDKTAGFASRVQRYGGAFPFGFPLDGQHWLLRRLRGRRGPVPQHRGGLRGSNSVGLVFRKHQSKRGEPTMTEYELKVSGQLLSSLLSDKNALA
jgi:hypothetical protein